MSTGRSDSQAFTWRCIKDDPETTVLQAAKHQVNMPGLMSHVLAEMEGQQKTEVEIHESNVLLEILHSKEEVTLAYQQMRVIRVMTLTA